MGQSFLGREGEWWAETSNLFQVEEGGSDLTDMLEGKIAVKIDSMLPACGERDRKEVLMVRQKMWLVLVSDLGLMMIMSFFHSLGGESWLSSMF